MLRLAALVTLTLPGLALAQPVHEGFGEERPKVKTADETDEARNRRPDYVLAAEEPEAGSGVFRWREAR